MTDKTCGSCINLMRDYIEDQNGYVGGACRVSLFGGNYRYVLCAAICSEPLGLYEERTDGLETVALDAVRMLEKAAAQIDVERWEQIVYSQVDDLRARLKALGVEP
ncbi:hypothetical protein [Raoultibacter timonensis]|uniref:hypothetical protein n=1 Tax=Raoultibacter timonensis TaxID=1907662 RepID=UPI0026DC1F15|nr:hypothetical protein [Raoultibacter timonensis]